MNWFKKKEYNTLFEIINSNKELLAENKKLLQSLRDLIKRVNCVEDNLYFIGSHISCCDIDYAKELTFCLDGANVEMVGDFRANRFINKLDAVKVSLFNRGKIQTSYTARSCLSNEELEEYNKLGYILIREDKQ